MSTLPKNPIICVDFDGVIHSYASGWQGADVIPDEPIPGALDWLRDHLPIPEAISTMGPEYVGPEAVIYSARSSQSGGIKAMRKWFIKHGMHPAYFSDDILKFPRTKPPAFLTLDARAICFTGRFPTTSEMMSFVSWQKLGVGGERLPAVMTREEISEAHDRLMERSVGAMAVAEGEEDWRKVPIDCPMLAAVKNLREAYDALREKQLGATGKFPEGKDYSDDEGEIRLGVAHDQDNVIIGFGTPVAWLALPPENAAQLAALILSHVNQIRP